MTNPEVAKAVKLLLTQDGQGVEVKREMLTALIAVTNNSPTKEQMAAITVAIQQTRK